MSFLRSLFLVDYVVQVGRRISGPFKGSGKKKPAEARAGRDKPTARHAPSDDGTMVVGGSTPMSEGPHVAMLEGQNGIHEGEKFMLRPGRNTIGTAWANDVVLTDSRDYIDPEHAVIECRANGCVVSDLGSRFGTWLTNQQQITSEYRLEHDGELLQFGGLAFRFYVLGAGRKAGAGWSAPGT